MSAETKTYEDKMTGVINHLVKEHATIRAGRANPAILDKVTVDYYGTPTPSIRWPRFLWQRRACSPSALGTLL